MRFDKETVEKIINTPVYHDGTSTGFVIFMVNETSLEDIEEALRRLEIEGKQVYKRELLLTEIKSRTIKSPSVDKKLERFGVKNIKEWYEMMEFWKNAREGRLPISRPNVIIQESKYITWVIHTRR